MYTALPLPTRSPDEVPFICLLILPTGNTNPALEALDLPSDIAAFAFFAFRAYLPPLPNYLIGMTFPPMLSIEPVLANAFDNFFFCS